MFDHIRAYHQPHSIKEAIHLLERHRAHACLLAGGTDIVVRAGRTVTDLVDISQLGLEYIKRDGKGLRIGAATTLAEIENSAFVQKLANGILARAAASCGTVQTRNVATIGGNLANGSPAADTAPPLLALGAHVVMQKSRGKRVVPLCDFFRAPHQTIADGALVTEIVIPAPKMRSAYSFQRFARTEVDIAIVSVAAALRVDAKGRCTEARIALGAVAPQPMRALGAEAALVKAMLTAETMNSAADAAAREIRPITDVRASADYRTELTRVLVRRALQDCAQQLERAL